MGTFKEFIEKLQSDEEFLAKINSAVAAKQEAGDTESNRILIAAAKECGYVITEEEINTFNKQQKENMADLNEEEMGKVAGGTGGLVTISLVVVSSASGLVLTLTQR